MKPDKKAILLGIFLLLFSFPLFAFELGMRGIMDNPPAPELISPTTETVDLTAKAALEFKWVASDFMAAVENYDFRLYKGYETTQANLISKQTLSADTGKVLINADLFQDGAVYTWVLRRTFNAGQKSDRSFASFRVIKK